MDLDFSEEQQMLADLAKGLCEEHCPVEVVRAAETDPAGYAQDLWKQLGETGLVGLSLPEAHGGGGQTLLEGAILYEQLGRALAPTPHFVSAAICGELLARAGTAQQQSEWLGRIAGGDAIFSVAWLEPESSSTARGITLRAKPDGDGFALNGSKRHVGFATSAERLIVLARTGDEEEAIDLFLVDPKQSGVSVTPQRNLATDSQCEVRFENVRVAKSDRVGDAGAGWAHFERVLTRAIVLAAAQAVGGADRALEITVEYAKERKQFGKQIGAFQSISHYLADAATCVAGARTLVHQAAWADAVGKPIDQLAPMAKLYACKTFRDVTAMCQQVWGGVGFTIEYDIQLYFRRAKQLQLSWWDDRALEERIASTALD